MSLSRSSLTLTVLVSGAVFAVFLAALAQLPIVGQILAAVVIVQVAATALHSAASRRPRVLEISK